MKFAVLAIEKNGQEVTHPIESPHEAVEMLGKLFVASLDDDNEGVKYSIWMEDTKKP